MGNSYFSIFQKLLFLVFFCSFGMLWQLQIHGIPWISVSPFPAVSLLGGLGACWTARKYMNIYIYIYVYIFYIYKYLFTTTYCVGSTPYLTLSVLYPTQSGHMLEHGPGRWLMLEHGHLQPNPQAGDPASRGTHLLGAIGSCINLILCIKLTRIRFTNRGLSQQKLCWPNSRECPSVVTCGRHSGPRRVRAGAWPSEETHAGPWSPPPETES